MTLTLTKPGHYRCDCGKTVKRTAYHARVVGHCGCRRGANMSAAKAPRPQVKMSDDALKTREGYMTFLWLTGETYTAIAERMKLSRQRVHQIVRATLASLT